jgi:hypothetical protein
VKSKPIRFVIISCLAAVIDFVSGCAHLGKTDAELAMPKPDAILSVMQRVADWQLAHPSLHRADDWPPADGLDPAKPFWDISCAVKCCVDLYGIADIGTYHDVTMLGKSFAEAPEVYRLASPVTYVRSNSPPFLLLHGTADTTVKLEQSQLLADALARHAVKHEFVVVPGAPIPLTCSLHSAICARWCSAFWSCTLGKVPAHQKTEALWKWPSHERKWARDS